MCGRSNRALLLLAGRPHKARPGNPLPWPRPPRRVPRHVCVPEALHLLPGESLVSRLGVGCRGDAAVAPCANVTPWHPVLHAQVAGTYAGGEDNGNGDGDGDGGVEEDAMTEVRLVPQDAGELEGLFESMCECAALHPDEEGAESGEEGDDVFFEAAAMRGATEEQRRAMERLGDMLGGGGGGGEGGGDSNGQFEDAEEP